MRGTWEAIITPPSPSHVDVTHSPPTLRRSSSSEGPASLGPPKPTAAARPTGAGAGASPEEVMAEEGAERRPALRAGTQQGWVQGLLEAGENIRWNWNPERQLVPTASSLLLGPLQLEAEESKNQPGKSPNKQLPACLKSNSLAGGENPPANTSTPLCPLEAPTFPVSLTQLRPRGGSLVSGRFEGLFNQVS